MNTIRIRLYEGEERSVVGFSSLADGIQPNEATAIDEYLKANNQIMSPVDTPEHLSHMAGEYYMIEPPLGEAQVRRFGSLCIDYSDTGKNSVYFIDNRKEIPQRPLQTAGQLVNWI